MNWLPDMDLKHDKQIQSLLCQGYCTRRMRASRAQSRPDPGG